MTPTQKQSPTACESSNGHGVQIVGKLMDSSIYGKAFIMRFDS